MTNKLDDFLEYVTLLNFVSRTAFDLCFSVSRIPFQVSNTNRNKLSLDYQIHTESEHKFVPLLQFKLTVLHGGMSFNRASTSRWFRILGGYSPFRAVFTWRLIRCLQKRKAFS
mmetsp:Transcript_9602/g.17302  ORF Transcript_9602/g.17302 Transcript_9602/m.17302 type:complete len:113 (-) Transcript_9602:94-432(-)